ncbi:MAG: hypothetical protein QMC81_11125 [Thermoanaerobacterales bacterium]|nr:hypothetical protein [Thermoanaerobacterales bacterium]
MLLHNSPRTGRNPPRGSPVSNRLIKTLLAAASAFLVALALVVPSAHAASWEYRITETDTPTTIDQAATTAVVDTQAHEIRLPKGAPKAAAFWGNEALDYIVMAPDGVKHFSWDGTQMVENTVVSVPGITNPLAAFTSSPYPDVIVADGDRNQVTHYSFTGSEMVENLALSVAGLTGVVAVGSRDVDLAALADGKLEYYGWDGSTMVQIPALSVQSGLTNPIDFALFPGSYDFIVLDGNQARYYSAGTENPALAITGLVGAKAIAAADGGNVAIVQDNQVKHYSLAGESFTYNAALSVTSGLTSPTCVALRPGTYDRLIVDGDEVRYYMWDGAELVYNPALSVTVAGLQDMGNYYPSAVAQSQLFDPGPADVSWVRVRAYCSTPPRTSVTWAVTADGVDWITRWRVVGLDGGGTSLEVSPGTGATWQAIGDGSKAWPTANTFELWCQVPAGQAVGWRATLATNDPKATPKVVAPVPDTDIAVLLDAGNPPVKPVIPEQGSCYTTSTPTFSWSFVDPDAGDMQGGYEIEIAKLDATPVYQSGVVQSTETSFRVPTSQAPDLPGPLWASGDYRFTVRMRLYDSMGIPSEWSDPAEFCVVAFERPRIRELVSVPQGSPQPDPADPATHLVITEGMTADQLPVTKAGGKVGLLVDSIGPVDAATARFPSLATEATVGTLPTVTETNGSNKRWLIEFWTAASLDDCPSGTVVRMELDGSGAEGTTALDAPPYAAGVVRTQGSVYEDWFVVLEGRDSP